MARSVVLKGAPRCGRCQLPPRWCICAGLRAVECPLAVDVLMHEEEMCRPSSTGHLIGRVLKDARLHRWDEGKPEIPLRTDRELWILHPLGDPVPAGTAPETVQVLLLDGSWRQALDMLRLTGRRGRRVSLPMTGESRYWLRTQNGPGRFSTVEALLFLLQALGLEQAHEALRRQFELHVYASLCARGQKARAAAYLVDSPVRAAFPELLARLAEKRPL